jgi:hypothetical protein
MSTESLRKIARTALLTGAITLGSTILVLTPTANAEPNSNAQDGYWSCVEAGEAYQKSLGPARMYPTEQIAKNCCIAMGGIPDPPLKCNGIAVLAGSPPPGATAILPPA